MVGYIRRTCAKYLVALVATALSLVVASPASARLTDTFVTAGNAQARWVNDPAAPPSAADRQSIELTVHARSAVDFNDAAWVALQGFASAPPATAPSFRYKISQAGASGGSVRLVIRFSDGGFGFLRPLTLEAGKWALADGDAQNWESVGSAACGTSLSYSQMVACHPGASVTSLEVINDSGWLYNGRFSALVDEISYGGEVVSVPAPPVLGETLNVAPVSGKVLVRLPDGKGVGPANASAAGRSDLDRVDGTIQGLPVGSKVDARRGTVKLISAKGRRGRQSGKFGGSVFTVGQTKRGKSRGVTTLRLKPASRRRCNTRRARHSSSEPPLANTARRRRGLLRKLRGRAKGRFRTRGRYSSAIVAGTIWETSDHCEGTLVRVLEGKVRVRDIRKKKTVLVKAGQSYLARAPGY